MKYTIVLLAVAFGISVMPVEGEQVHKTAQSMQTTTVKQVHSSIKLDNIFRVNSSHTPNHVIGQGGLEMPESTDKKTTRYSDTDAVNSALQAVVMTGVHSAMHGSKAKPWMERTVLSLRFQKNWKPLYGVETLQPLGHYDEKSRHVWFT